MLFPPLLIDSKTRENQKKQKKYPATNDSINARRRESYTRKKAAGGAALLAIGVPTHTNNEFYIMVDYIFSEFLNIGKYISSMQTTLVLYSPTRSVKPEHGPLIEYDVGFGQI
jgi:hypothetical protein